MKRNPLRPSPCRLSLALAVLLAGVPPARATIFPPPPTTAYWNAVEIAPANGLSNQLFVHALGDQGQVVGSYNDAGGDRGFIWSGVSGRAPQRLPLSDAWGLAPDGGVLGVALGSSLRREGFTSLTGQEYAVQVAPSGAISVLTPTNLTGNNAGQTFGMAFAANASGQVVGVSTDAAGQYGTALWTNSSAPSFIDISTGSRPGSFLGGRSSLAINATGTVVGGTSQLQTWTAAQGRTDLGGLAEATSSSGADINNAGRIVGTSSFGDGSSRGFVYNPDTLSFAALAGVGGTSDSAAWALNERGDVVGLSGMVGRVDSRATWWTPTGEAIDLNGLNFTNLSGVRLQTAVDINNRGQILVSGMRVDGSGQITDTGLRHWVLSLCERCGQIAPYPNATGTTLDVGPDWYDAFNAVHFENYGSVQLNTQLVNRGGASFTNRGDLVIGAAGRWSNDDLLVNDAGGRLLIAGDFENRDGRGVVNRGIVSVAADATLTLFAPGWLNDAGSTFIQAGGVVTNTGDFLSVRARVQQSGGEFSNTTAGDVTLMSSATTWAGQVTNQGRMLFTADPVDSPDQHAQVSLSGQMQNLGTGTLQLERGTRFDVAGGQLSSAGLLELSGAGTKLQALAGATLALQAGGYGRTSVQGLAVLEVQGQGAQLQLEHGAALEVGTQGSVYLRQGGEAWVRGEIHNAGALAVASGAQLTVSGRLENTGLLQVRGAGTVLTVQPSTLGDPDNPLVLRNQDHGVFELSEQALLQVGGLVNIYGPMTVSSGAGVLVDGGNFAVLGSVSGDGNLVQVSGKTYVMGEVSLQQLTFLGGQVGGLGVIRGRVTFDGTAPGAGLHILPGNSPGTLTLDGDVSLDGAVYELELGERVADQLIVTGQLALGRLDVALRPDGGYLPDLDDSFGFIRAGSVTALNGGSQVSIDLSALDSGWAQQFVQGSTGLRTTLDRPDAEALADVVPALGSAQVAAGAWGYSRQLRVDGLLEVAGRMTHRAQALDFETGAVLEAGQLYIDGGGTLSVLAGGVFSNRSELLNAGTLHNAGLLHNRQGGRITGSGPFHNDGVLRNDGLITQEAGTLRNTGLWEERGQLVTGPFAVVENSGDLQVTGRWVNLGLVTNAGRVHVLANGALAGTPDDSAAPAGTYQQYGAPDALTRVDGVFSQAQINFFDGALEGTGRLDGALTLGAMTVRPGGVDGPGLLTLAGTVQLSGTFIELAAGPEGSARLAVQGDLTLANPSSLLLVFQAGYGPTPGSEFELLRVDGALTGAALLSANAAYRDALGGLMLWVPPAGLTADFRWEGQQLVFGVSAVPEPGALWLWAVGLLAAGLLRRRAGRR